MTTAATESQLAAPPSQLAELQTLDADHVMQTYGRTPVAFVRGDGTRLWDTEGKEHLDFLCGLAVTSLVGSTA